MKRESEPQDAEDRYYLWWNTNYAQMSVMRLIIRNQLNKAVDEAGKWNRGNSGGTPFLILISSLTPERLSERMPEVLQLYYTECLEGTYYV
jgi:hypothetical protein